MQPTRRNLPGPGDRLFGLAGGGVCHAITVTGDAVRSYRTISPLPTILADYGGIFSAALSRGSPRAVVSRHRALSCSDFPPEISPRRSPNPLNESFYHYF